MNTPVHWIAEPTQVRDLRGMTEVVYPVGTKDAIPTALMLSRAGDTIGVLGRHKLFKLGVGDGSRRNEAVRAGGFIGNSVVGLDPDSTVEGITFGKSCQVQDIALEDLILDIQQQFGIQVMLGTMDYGTLSFRRLSILATPAFTTSVCRGHGSAGWIFEDCHMHGGVHEHALAYVDSPQGFVARRCTAEHGKRTMIQVVERNYSDMNGVTWPWTRGTGEVLIEDCEAVDCGQNGGSAFTIAGFDGDGGVTFRRLRVTDEVGTSAGAVVVYADGKLMSWMPPDRLGACKSFRLIGGQFNMLGGGAAGEDEDRDVVSISGCRDVTITPFAAWSDNRSALHLSYNGEPNGVVQFKGRKPPSQWDWSHAGVPRRNGNKLTSAELDAMYIAPTNQPVVAGP